MIPQEIIDKIFLHCDYKTLQLTRNLQSPFVQYSTRHKKIKNCILDHNYTNGNWLMTYKNHNYDRIYLKAVRRQQYHVLDFLQKINYKLVNNI